MTQRGAMKRTITNFFFSKNTTAKVCDGDRVSGVDTYLVDVDGGSEAK